MLYVFLGTDTNKTADALQKTLASVLSRAPGAHVERITDEAEALDIDGLLASQGLFHASRIVVLDGVLAVAAHKECVFDALAAIAASPHIFFLREASVSAPDLKKLERHAAKAVRYDAKEGKKESFNIFSVADALIARDKKSLWLRIVQALRAGASSEELHGILFWGAKNLILAGAPSAEESGMHPFVYKKTKAAREKFAPEEIERLLAELAILPHAARRRGVELEYALERFALSFPSTRGSAHASARVAAE